ncbi:MAG: dTMP kinase [Pontibacterium sp.]
MQRGCFITVEGTEGVGKSSNIAFVKQLIESKGYDVLLTREPGGTPFAEELREALLQKRDEAIDPKAELLVMFAARAQHLETVIKPALTAGKWVISDRFTDATYAYQGGGRCLDTELIGQLENLVQEGLQPDLTLLLDVDVEVGLARASARSAPDRFESEKVSFFERVRAAYLDRAAQSPKRYRVIDAGLPLDQVQSSISEVLRRFCDAQQAGR